MSEESLRSQTWTELKKASAVWRADVWRAARAIHRFFVPRAYPNGMPIGDLRILVTYEDDESLGPGRVFDVAAGLGGGDVPEVTVLAADGTRLAQRRLTRWQSGDRVREALAAQLHALGVAEGSPPPDDLQARLDRI